MVTITVTGTNDAPIALADVNSGTEDGAPVTGSVATNDSDADHGASLSYALVSPVAGLILNTDGSYSLDPSNAAYQHIALGATQVVTANYTVSDGLGGSSTATLSITLTGVNDGPVVTGTAVGHRGRGDRPRQCDARGPGGEQPVRAGDQLRHADRGAAGGA